MGENDGTGRLGRWVGIALVGAALAYVLIAPGRGGPERGSAAPGFSAPVLGEAKPFDLASTQGRVVVLDFWATWCPPCRKTLPVLERLHQRYRGSDVTVVGVNTDSGPDRVEVVQKFMRDNGYQFPVVLDAGGVSSAYKVVSIPLLVIVGRDGKVHEVEVGARMGDPAAVERLLAERIEALRGSPPAG